MVPLTIRRATSPDRAGRTCSFVESISSIGHHFHAAWSSCSRGSHPSVDSSNRSVRQEK
jgi:hypothetical protein